MKNASQLALIVDSVVPEPVPAGELAALPAVVAGADVAELELEEPLLEQAVIATASARPSAGPRKIRRAMWWNSTLLRLPRSRSDVHWYGQLL